MNRHHKPAICAAAAVTLAFTGWFAPAVRANDTGHAATATPKAPAAPGLPKAAAAAVPAAVAPHATTHSHWSYSGATGPDHWAELTADYKQCRMGAQQTPVDLKGTVDASLPKLNLGYRQSPLEMVNNGHTVQVNVADGQSMEVAGVRYQLAQYHLHAPSEHKVNGQGYDLELHLVHKSGNGELAVLGVFFKRGATHPTLDRLLDQAPRTTNGKVSNAEILIDPNLLVPATRSYFHYQGSLTTPPCSEGVRWFVLKEPLQASAEQIKRFTALFAGGTARPVQPLNSRFVFSGR
jgi:carbonic anhydrase